MISVGSADPFPALSSPSENPSCDYGYTMDMLAPSGDVQPCADPYTLNFTTLPGDSAGTLSSFGYGGFAGTSAAAPNVAGSAALLYSHYYRLDPTYLKHIEPEDIQGILKASAWRGDADRAAIGWTNCWRPKSGYGVLNIGKAFTMLDSGYELKHFSLIGKASLDHANDSLILWDTLRTGSWTDLPDNGYDFYIPYHTSSGHGTMARYKERSDLVDDSLTAIYHGQFRVDTIDAVIDSIWSIDSNNAVNLYAWGRSGGMSERSGWNLSQMNDQTGWSRVIRGTGGDSLNEGIFHSHSRTFRIITAQYNLWRVKDPANAFDTTGKIVLGNVPPDTSIGVNFTVFGKILPQYQEDVARVSRTTRTMTVSLNTEQTVLTVASGVPAYETSIVQLFDILGQEVASSRQIEMTSPQKSVTLRVSSLPSGTYFCRVYSKGIAQSQKFEIIR